MHRERFDARRNPGASGLWRPAIWFLLLPVLAAVEMGCAKEESRKEAVAAEPVRPPEHPFIQQWSAAPPQEAAAAAERGEVSAHYYLGWAHFRGAGGLSQDITEAFKWYQRAADQGVVEARIKLGLRHELGIACPADLAEATRWYRLAADQGNAWAAWRIGVALRGPWPSRLMQVPADAMKWYRQAAEMGFSQAQIDLAGLLVGIPLPHLSGGAKEAAEAVKWYEAAALQGKAEAAMKLGDIYSRGLGVPADKVEAGKWWHLAARLGNSLAAARIKHPSLGLTPLEAEEAGRRADALTVRRPEPFNLHFHDLLFYGGTPGSHFDPLDTFHQEFKDLFKIHLREEFESLTQAAENGDARAQFNLALSFQHTGNPGAAAEWYKRAAEQGHLGASVCLAFAHLNGHIFEKETLTTNSGETLVRYKAQPIPVDPIAALTWLSKAAGQDNAEARWHLANLHRYGLGYLAPNYPEAIKWYRLAAESGHPLAASRIPEIFDFGASKEPGQPQAAGTGRTGAAAGNSTSVENHRFAVLAVDPSLREAADLLITELSANPSLTLLEQDQIDRVFREWNVSASGQKNYLQLGRLLGADGVLLLETIQRAGESVTAGRLVAVKPGVVLAIREYPHPLSASQEWSKLAAGQFQELFPKLGVLPADAVPLSILGLRAAVATPESVALERELTLLLSLRLPREKELFVTERSRMETLAREQSLAGGGDGGFWSGSYLLEGTINRDGMTADQVTIHGRLAPPGGGPVVQIEATGARRGLVQLVEDYTAKILEALDKNPQPQSWNPLNEACRYFEEAKWAAIQGLTHEAQRACEASWALGLRVGELAELRIRTYIQHTSTDRHGLKFGVHMTQHLPLGEVPADPAKLKPAQRAIDLYTDHTRTHFAAAAPATPWLRLGEEVLFRTSLLLRHFFVSPASRKGVEEELASLRSGVRDLAALLEPHKEGTNLDSLKAGYGRFWMETPEETLRMYHGFASQGRFRLLLDARAADPRIPMLVQWRGRDTLKLESLWEDFLNQACQSGDLKTRLEARKLRVSMSASDYDLEDNVVNLLRLFTENRESLMPDDLNSDNWTEAKETVLDRLKDPYRRIQAGIKDKLLPEFERPFKELAARRLAEERNRQMDELRALLNRPSLNTSDLHKYQSLEFDEQTARELYPLVQTHQRKLGNFAFGIAWLERKLSAKLPASELSAPTAPVAPAAPPAIQAVTKSGVAPVVEPRFWTLPTPPKAGRPPRISDVHYKDGRIWVQSHHVGPDPDSGRNAAHTTVQGVDPATHSVVAVQFPPDPDAPLYNSSFIGIPRLFEVHKDFLFARVVNKIRRYSLLTHQWENLPLDLAPETRFFSLNGRLYCTTADSILELDDSGNQARVLASGRRQPPLTLIDSIPSYSFPPLFVGPSGSLRVLLGGNVFTYDAGGRDWKFTTALPKLTRVSAEPHPGGLISRGSQMIMIQTDILLGEWNSFETQFTNAFAGQRLAGVSPHSRWDAPEDIKPSGQPSTLDGLNLWVHVLAKERLLYYHASQRAPAIFSLKLNLPAGVAATRDEAVPLDPDYPAGRLMATPTGLAIWRPEHPGIWFVPKSDLRPGIESHIRDSLAGSRQRQETLARRQSYWTQLFDQNKNGKLEPEEEALMRRSPLYKKEQAEMGAGADPQLLQNLLGIYDSNRDGFVDAGEFQRMIVDEPGFFPLPIASLSLRQFDRNTDQRLELKELELAVSSIKEQLLGGQSKGNAAASKPGAASAAAPKRR